MDDTQKVLLGAGILGGAALLAYLASAKPPEKPPGVEGQITGVNITVA